MQPMYFWKVQYYAIHHVDTFRDDAILDSTALALSVYLRGS